MPTKYVMALDANGKSDVVLEQDITQLPSPAPGLTAMDLWVNEQTPADLSPAANFTGGSFVHEPPNGGAIFRVIDFQPRQQRTVESMRAVHAAIGSVHVPSDSEFKAIKDPSLHKTDTLNYFCIVSGEVWALSEGRDVLLKAGDVMIQKGCMHGWRNTSDKVCRLIGVLIDSDPA